MKVGVRQLLIAFSFLLLSAVRGQIGWAYIYTLSGYEEGLSLKQYNESSGEFIQALQKPQGQFPNSVFSGPNNYLYAVTQNIGPWGMITRYDAVTGAFVNVFTPDQWGPGRETMFGPDGNIYSRGNYEQMYPTSASFIHKIDGNTGAVVQERFVSFPLSPATSYFDFGPDGNIFVGLSTGMFGIQIYSGTNGLLLGQLPLPGSDYLTFGPDNSMFGVINNKVMKYQAFDTGFGLGWNAPVEFADTRGFMSFGPDGNLYVANSMIGKLAKYDGQTGAYLGDVISFAPGQELFFTFAGGEPVVTPEPASMVLFGLGGAAMALARLRRNVKV